ncbi:hypothetical protein [Tateyamaria sp.]|uniref:hypothetical protein n=1 Tax=Tateyamaria sp. TaxID=1929288 RepID=UPI003B218A7E
MAEPSGDVNANRAHIAAWEIWTIHPFSYAGGTPTGCIFLGSVSDQGFVSLRSHHGKFLRGVPNGDARADLSAVDTAPMPGNSTFIAMYRHPWTDFYYKRGIPSMDGACNRCPDGGRWDGANCFIAEQGAQTGFTYEGNVYVQGGPTCVYGDYDGANCKLSSLTQGQKPFVYNGSLYARDACAPQDTASSGDDCRATMFGNAENAISGTAKMQAKNAWRRAVNTTHGPDFKRWTKAQFRRVDCVQTGTVLNWNYECTAIGNPCHKDQ